MSISIRPADIAGQNDEGILAPISSHDAMVATDTVETRSNMSAWTAYVLCGQCIAQTDLNDLVTRMRTIFDMKLVSIQPTQNTITVRAPREQWKRRRACLIT